MSFLPLFHLCPLHSSLQARDEAITFLRADKMEPASLEAHYGFATPDEALRALQRDSLRLQACEALQARRQDVYEKPVAEVNPTPPARTHWESGG